MLKKTLECLFKVFLGFVVLTTDATILKLLLNCKGGKHEMSLFSNSVFHVLSLMFKCKYFPLWDGSLKKKKKRGWRGRKTLLCYFRMYGLGF